MIIRKNEIYFNVGKGKQITLYGYDWRHAILNWTINGRKPIYYFSIEFLRFKFEWYYPGTPF